MSEDRKTIQKCLECGAQFKTYGTLKRHVQKLHPEKVAGLAPLKQKTKYNFECHCGKRFNKSANYNTHLKSHEKTCDKADLVTTENNLKNKCNKCETYFYTYSNLRKHAHKFHPNEVDTVAPLRRKKSGTYAFTCHCGKQFNYRRHYKFHLKIHGEVLSDDVGKTVSIKHKLKECPMCHIKSNKQEMLEHFKKVHNIDVILKNMVFTTFEDFTKWKEELEQNDKVSFVKERGLVYKKSRNSCYSKSVYICHRSGYFKERGKGLRKLKHQGTNKINAFCPAEIKVLLYNSGVCKITYLETHVGHENDLDHLKLTPTQRKVLAEKIASKIPFQSILHEIRNIGAGDGMGRFQLVKKKDLYNIEASFKLQSNAIRHSSDTGNIDAWVLENINCVLFHKPRDVISEQFPQLRTTDFVLCIMNSCQMEALNKFYNYCLSIDYVKDNNDLSQIGYDLHSLIVLDDWKQAIPCAFMVSNRSEQDVLEVFFQTVKNALRVPIKPKLFISDVLNVYYDAWIRIMGEPEQRLYGTWFVKKAWRDHMDLIQSKEKQEEVYNSLHNLLVEYDSSVFMIMIGEFFQKTASDPDTLHYSTYFKDEFLKTINFWSSCSRDPNDLASDMKLERLHRALEYVYQQGGHAKRLDKAIGRLMKFVKDRVFERGQSAVLDQSARSASVIKNKFNKKLTMIDAAHETSLSMDVSIIRNNRFSWYFSSGIKDMDGYNVWKNNIYCDCQQKCKICKSCVHHYCCSCIESSVRGNMCEHIHLLCRYLTPIETESNNIPIAEPEDDNQWIPCEPAAEEEHEAWFQTLTQIVPKESIEIKKLQIMEQLRRIINGINTMAEIDMLEKLIASLEPTLASAQTSGYR